MVGITNCPNMTSPVYSGGKATNQTNSNKNHPSFEFRHEKTAFCICENKDADQLHGNHEADQRLCFCYIGRIIPLIFKSKISSL